MPIEITPRFISERDAAAYLSVSRSFLRNARYQGLLGDGTPGPPYRKIGGAVRYEKAELDSWLDKYFPARLHSSE